MGNSNKGGGSKKSAAADGDEVKERPDGEEPKMSDAEFKEVARDNPDAAAAYSFWDGKKTFKPIKNPQTKKQHELQKTIKATMQATLGGGELRKTVKLPEGEDENEWIAVNSVHFYNAANMIYGTCAEFCTQQACPSMTAGAKYEYLWKDNVKYKKPTRVPAPVYIDNLLNWVNEQISNPQLFPVDEGAKFPANFKSQVKVIYKRLFRLYAHIYYQHFDSIRAIGANAHLNTCFKHFIFFVQEFKLIDDEELAPLKKLIDKFAADK